MYMRGCSLYPASCRSCSIVSRRKLPLSESSLWTTYKSSDMPRFSIESEICSEQIIALKGDHSEIILPGILERISQSVALTRSRKRRSLKCWILFTKLLTSRNDKRWYKNQDWSRGINNIKIAYFQSIMKSI